MPKLSAGLLLHRTAGDGAAGGAAGAPWRAVLGETGRGCVVDPEGRVRARRGPTGGGVAGVRRGAGPRPAAGRTRRRVVPGRGPPIERQAGPGVGGSGGSRRDHDREQRRRDGMAERLRACHHVPGDRPGRVVRASTRPGGASCRVRSSCSTASRRSGGSPRCCNRVGRCGRRRGRSRDRRRNDHRSTEPRRQPAGGAPVEVVGRRSRCVMGARAPPRPVGGPMGRSAHR